VLYYIKVTKFIKLPKLGLFEEFCVLYYIKFTMFLKLQTLVF